MDVLMRQKQYQKQQRWLLLLRHVSKCIAPEGTCTAVAHCHQVSRLTDLPWALVNDLSFYAKTVPRDEAVSHGPYLILRLDIRF